MSRIGEPNCSESQVRRLAQTVLDERRRPPRASVPVRVLHVLGSLSVGGVETWLSTAVQQLDRSAVETHFFLHSHNHGTLAPSVRAAGCRITSTAGCRNLFAYSRDFFAALQRLGPIDVVHSHVHHFSGVVLYLARLAGVPIRIAHSHSAPARDACPTRVRRIYLSSMKSLIARHMTRGLAASRPAAAALFGTGWQTDSRVSVLHCGTDLQRFQVADDRTSVRRALGLTDSDVVVGHVGRFVEPKNHSFMVDIALAAAEMEPRIRFLFVGDGPLLPDIRARVLRCGLESRVVFAGMRRDVPALLGAMDVFLFPSLWEGMPLGLVEAQAAGLPCVVSGVVAPESFVVRNHIFAMALEAPPSEWADAIFRAYAVGQRAARTTCFRAVEQSSFELTRATRALHDVYCDG